MEEVSFWIVPAVIGLILILVSAKVGSFLWNLILVLIGAALTCVGAGIYKHSIGFGLMFAGFMTWGSSFIYVLIQRESILQIKWLNHILGIIMFVIGFLLFRNQI